MSDPVRQFEHSHGRLTKLATEIREMIRAEAGDAQPTAAARKQLVLRLEALRDELLQHFADEEEGLFPFLRSRAPTKTAVVDRLESAHDTVCGTLVRLAHLAANDRPALGGGRPTLRDLYERFETAYTVHSREEASLFDELGRTLDQGQRTELAVILRGL